jgi:hypothetical protein
MKSLRAEHTERDDEENGREVVFQETMAENFLEVKKETSQIKNVWFSIHWDFHHHSSTVLYCHKGFLLDQGLPTYRILSSTQHPAVICLVHE